jgi:AraC family transcriptional regulator
VTGAAFRHTADCVALPDAALVLPPTPLALALRAARESVFADGASALVAEALCLEMLARTSEGPGGAGREPTSSPGWLRRARELLRDACGEDLSIGDIAGALGVHPVHLTRTFRRRFRCTPGEYLRRCRLQKATALLADSASPLAEVALASGFADQSHLTKSFKQAFGVTPAVYRRSRR